MRRTLPITLIFVVAGAAAALTVGAQWLGPSAPPPLGDLTVVQLGPSAAQVNPSTNNAIWIDGTASGTDLLQLIGSAGPGSPFVVGNDGHVGILTTPAAGIEFDVLGDAQVSGDLRANEIFAVRGLSTYDALVSVDTVESGRFCIGDEDQGPLVSECISDWDEVVSTGGGVTSDGSGLATRVAFWTTDNTTLGGNANLFWNNTSSRLGINDPTPSYPLDVSGDLRISGDYRRGTFQGLSINCGVGTALNGPRVEGGIIVGLDVPNCEQIDGTVPVVAVAGDTLRYDGANWVANNTLFNDGTDVGIGTPSPSARLDVTGTSEFNGTMNLVNNRINNVGDFYFNDPGDQEGIIWRGSAAKIFVSPLNSGNSDGYLRLINDGGIVFESGAEDTEVMTLTAAGNVGIGTAGPTSSLHIRRAAADGSPNVTGVQIKGGANASIELTGTATPFIDFQNDTGGTDYDARIRLTGNDSLAFEGTNVGILTTPGGGYALDVNGDLRALEIFATRGFSTYDANVSVNTVEAGTYCIGDEDTGGADCISSWASAGGDDGDWTISGSNIYSAVSGNVGIGDSSPANKLTVMGGALMVGIDEAWDRIRLSATSGVSTIHGGDNRLDLVTNNNAGFDIALMPGTGANVGIGTTNPGEKLDVVGNIIASGTICDSVGCIGAGAGADSDWVISGSSMYSGVSGNVGIGDTTPDAKLDIVGGLLVSGTVSIGGGTGKLNVGIIDPVYTIGGERFATYVPAMIGQKEEHAGLVELIDGVAILDFKNAQSGSDLWLFSKITDLDDNFSKLVVLLTPSFASDVWYEKDYGNMKVLIYGQADGEVSYRLTAPRFDWFDLDTRLEPDSSTPGFIIE